MRKSVLKRFKYKPFYGTYTADGLSVKTKNTSFLQDPGFNSAWEFAEEANKNGWKNQVPDIRWRAHIACWAASHGLRLGGDFVECGVHTGILSLTILHYLKDRARTKKFWLFDTFDGIPLEHVPEKEKAKAMAFNNDLYFDCYDIAKHNFKKFDQAILVKGIIPDSFGNVDIEEVSYLSLDLNNSYAEIQSLDFFWNKLSSSAIVLLDDYGGIGHEEQKTAIDRFAAKHDVPVAMLPTGQGIIIKP